MTKRLGSSALLRLGKVAAVVWMILWVSSLGASYIPRKPKVRAITAFLRIDRDHYAQQIQSALIMLRSAKVIL